MPEERGGSSYVHGSAPREQERLDLMNDLLNDTAVREMRLRGGERILDLGCGLGQLTRALARAAGPTGAVLGIERDPEQIAAFEARARRDGEERLVEVREGEALHPPLLDREWGAFDVAHARFLLEHLPDPLAAVRVLARAARPGGRVVLQDEDHDVLRLWPEPPEVTALWRAYMETYERNGNDPSVGRRLVALLHQAGLRPRRCTWIFFGGCAGEARFAPLVENMARILEGAAGAVTRFGILDAQACRRGIAALRAWGRRPDAALWFALAWAEGESVNPPDRP